MVLLEKSIEKILNNGFSPLRLASAVLGSGMLLWALLLWADALLNNHPLSYGAIVALHKSEPVWNVALLLPMLLAYLSYRTGSAIAKVAKQKIAEDSAKINSYATSLEQVKKLSRGDLNIHVDTNSGSEHENELNRAILSLRSYLLRSREEQEVRRMEEQQRQWTTEGIALFSELLRASYPNMQEFSYAIVSNLVKYVDATQGGIFLLEHDENNIPYFSQAAAFAYDRRRMVSNRIEWGSGLVGAAAYEKESIYLTDIPDSYVSITSGLGTTRPKCLLVIPLITDSEVMGVVEVASLNAIKDHERDLLEKIGSSIASTIQTLKITHHTNTLLEQSRKQADMLRIQEEEMRQTIEELNATQEEAARKSNQLLNFTESVNQTMVRAEYDLNGRLLYANKRFLAKMEYDRLEEVLGTNVTKFIDKKDQDWFFKIWDGLVGGGSHFEGDMKHLTRSGNDFWSMATYTCIRDERGNVLNILFMGIDITELKKLSIELESQVYALNNSTIKVELTPKGVVHQCNNKFLKLMATDRKELVGKSLFDFFEGTYHRIIKSQWESITQGISYEDQFLLFSHDGRSIWLHGTLTAVFDMYNDLTKVVFIANDITSQKKLELANNQKTEKLEEQEAQLKQSQSILVQKLQEIESVKLRNEETLEGAMDAIITINSNEEVELFNRAAEQLLGYSKNEVMGKSITEILPSKYKALSKGDVIQFLKSDSNIFKGARNEVQLNDKYGNELSVLLTISEARFGNDFTFTAFIQNISVELF